MKQVYNDVVECIGNTPIVRLNSVTKGFKANVYAKLEYLNPANSVKDRIAVQIIDDAVAAGELQPGGTIVRSDLWKYRSRTRYGRGPPWLQDYFYPPR